MTSKLDISVLAGAMGSSEFSVSVSVVEEDQGTVYSVCQRWVGIAQDYSGAHEALNSFSDAIPAAEESNDTVGRFCVLVAGHVSSEYFNIPLSPLYYTRILKKEEAQAIIANIIGKLGADITRFDWLSPGDNDCDGVNDAAALLSNRESEFNVKELAFGEMVKQQEEEDVRLKEEDARLKQEDARLKQEDARLKQEDARVKAESAKSAKLLKDTLGRAREVSLRASKVKEMSAKLAEEKKHAEDVQEALNTAQKNFRLKVLKSQNSQPGPSQVRLPSLKPKTQPSSSESVSEESGSDYDSGTDSDSSSEDESGSNGSIAKKKGKGGKKRKKGGKGVQKGVKKRKMNAKNSAAWVNQELAALSLEALQEKYEEEFGHPPSNRMKNDKSWIISKLLENAL